MKVFSAFLLLAGFIVAAGVEPRDEADFTAFVVVKVVGLLLMVTGALLLRAMIPPDER